MEIRIIRARQYSSSQVSKLREALSLFQNSINSLAFEELILQHAPFDTEDQLSNREIYERIIEGREIGTRPNNTADLDLTLDFRHSSDRVGYTTDRSIFTFANMFDGNTPVFLSGHFAHEYCHTLGFRDPEDLSDTSRNVPYEVGDLISYIGSGANLRVNLIKKAAKTETLKNKPAAKKVTRKKSVVKKTAKNKPAAKKKDLKNKPAAKKAAQKK